MLENFHLTTASPLVSLNLTNATSKEAVAIKRNLLTLLELFIAVLITFKLFAWLSNQTFTLGAGYSLLLNLLLLLVFCIVTYEITRFFVRRLHKK